MSLTVAMLLREKAFALATLCLMAAVVMAQTPLPTVAPVTFSPTLVPTTSPTVGTPTFAPVEINEECNTGLLDRKLNDCPLVQVDLSTENGFQLALESVDWPLPYINKSNNDAVEGSFVFIGKGYRVNDNPVATIPGPTIIMPKGTGVPHRINLVNNLRPTNQLNNTLTSNIHTHGLHVASNEDDVTLRVEPGNSHLYEYNLPEDHAGGSHWYHPHMHPLAELFVGSGAAGFILVEDDKLGREIPVEMLPGNLPEFQLIFMHVRIPRTLDLSDGVPKSAQRADEDFSETRTDLNDPTVGVSFPGRTREEGLNDLKEEFFTVNGFYQPILELEQNRWYRIRMLLVAPVNDLMMRLYNNVEAGCTVKMLSRDGVYLPDGPRLFNFEDPTNPHRIHIHPASRVDVMIRCSGAPGSTAEFFDDFRGFNVNGIVFGNSIENERERMLQIVVKARTDPIPTAGELPEDFEVTPCMPLYLQDLRNASLQVYGGLSEPQVDELLSQNSLRPNFRNFWDDGKTTYEIIITPWDIRGTIFDDWKTNDTATSDQSNITVMPLGNVQEWDMINSVNHPLHIHVNHFQLMEDIGDGSGFFRAGDWVDTVRPADDSAKFRFLPDLFTGRVALHCHNMDHSDQGAKAEAYIADFGADSSFLNMARPWGSTCPNVVAFQTDAPTPVPTSSPTTSPTVSPNVVPTPAPSTPEPTANPTSSPVTLQPTSSPVTLQPTSSPVTDTPTTSPTSSPSGSPTQTPTITKLQVVVPREILGFADQGVTLSAAIEDASPFIDVSYCWSRTASSSGFSRTTEAALGGIDKDSFCSDGSGSAPLLDLVYEGGRNRNVFVIRPGALSPGQTYEYQLRAIQAENEAVISPIVITTPFVPRAGTISVNPTEGRAASDKFTIGVTRPAGGEDLTAVIAILRETTQDETVALTVLDPGVDTVTDVLLPLMDGVDQASFVTLVAFFVSEDGAFSDRSESLSVRLIPPETNQVAFGAVASGIDNTMVELRNQLALSSVVGLNRFAQLEEGERESVLENVGKAVDILFTAPEVFSQESGELALFTLRIASISLRASDPPTFASDLLSKFVAVLDLWLTKLNEQLLLKETTTPDLRVTLMVYNNHIRVALEFLAKIASLPFVCELEGDTTLEDALVLVQKWALRLRSPYQDTIRINADGLSMELVNRAANIVGGRYQPSLNIADSYVEINSLAFYRGSRFEYDTISVGVLSLPLNAFCLTPSTPPVAEDNNSSLIVVSPATRRLQEANVSNSSEEVTPEVFGDINPVDEVIELEQFVVSESLRVMLDHNSSDYDPVTGQFEISLRNVLNLDLPDTISAAKCGMLNLTTARWNSDSCAVTKTEESSLICQCNRVPSTGAIFGAFVEPDVRTTPEFNWVLILSIFGSVGLLWFLPSMWLYGRDKIDADRVQKGALLLFTSNKHFSKTEPVNPKPYLRSALNVMHTAAQRGYAGVTRRTKTSLWVRIENAHSLLGLLHFSARVPRLARSLAVPLGIFAAFASVPALAFLPLELALPVAMTIVACVQIGVNGLLGMLATHQRQDFHRVAHLQSKTQDSFQGNSSKPATDWSQKDRRSSSQSSAISFPIDGEAKRQLYSPEEDDLFLRQIRVYRLAQNLKNMQRQHDRSISFSTRLWRAVRFYMWFLPNKTEKAYLTRVYGGKTDACAKYERARNVLAKMEREYSTRRWRYSPAPLLTALSIIGILALEAIFIIFYAVDDRDGLTWTAYALLCYVGATIVLEPLLLAFTLSCCWQRAKWRPFLTKPRARFYSWDSAVSTRSLDLRPPIEDEDVEHQMKPRRKKTNRRNSAFSTKSGLTIKSGVSLLFRRHNIFSTNTTSELDDFSDFESDDGYETSSEWHGSTRSKADSAFNFNSSSRSLFARPKGGTFDEVISPGELKARPDDTDFV